ncbi:DUF429 domain-containing protein [Cellulomonas septica]|uniref:DUF429 domain-containing protein n=1 Tax=Cellulomonas septica TaxID=285080 RepID=A0ABX1K437_9CELL|nr:DUF429 domain-containing protein [Cellulomonas septica]NKY40377.1 DUF429 domain-containing protein [Cellulomonas septica]
MHYVGVDLAWGERARTGVAVLDDTGRLIRSTTVRTDAEIATAVAPPDAGPSVIAIDAPIVVPNATGSRRAEQLLHQQFGRYDAGAHPSNRSRPYFDPPRAARLAGTHGWDVDPAHRPDGSRTVAIEVYPHPAMVALFGLGRVIPYKVKPGRTLDTLRDAWGALLDHVDRVCGPVLRTDESPRWAQIRRTVDAAGRVAELRSVEDEVDAIFCAYLAWLWGTGDERMTVLGDVRDGYIVVPGPPTAPPAPRPTVRRSSPAAPESRRDLVALVARALRDADDAVDEAQANRLAPAVVDAILDDPAARAGLPGQG